MTDSQFAVAAGVVVAALCLIVGYGAARLTEAKECAIVVKDQFGNVHEMRGRCNGID